MSRTLSEQKVLAALNIPDFRHLSKENVLSFASMLPRMDAEVAKKALEQFPNFVSTSLDIMKEYKSVIDKALDDNTDSSITCYNVYIRVMDSLQTILERDNLSFDEKLLILNQMHDVSEKVDAIDSKNKKFLMQAMSIAGMVAFGVISVIASTLGADVKVNPFEKLDK